MGVSFLGSSLYFQATWKGLPGMPPRSEKAMNVYYWTSFLGAPCFSRQILKFPHHKVSSSNDQNRAEIREGCYVYGFYQPKASRNVREPQFVAPPFTRNEEQECEIRIAWGASFKAPVSNFKLIGRHCLVSPTRPEKH